MTEKKYQIGDYQAGATINAPLAAINLGDWMFTLTSEEYCQCAEGHQGALQGRMPDGKRLSINMETIGGIQMVQYYVEAVATRDRVVGISPNTSMWVEGEIREVEVHWELRATAIDDSATSIVCQVTSYTASEEMLAAIKERAKSFPPGSISPVQMHIEEEAPLFAKDIERKAKAGVWS